MNDIVINRMKGVAKFKPQEAKNRVKDAEMIADRAARMHDWPQLAEAMDYILDAQTEILVWWRENVRGPGKVNSRRSGEIGMPEAEKLTGISNQQVSKWAKRLTDRVKYRETLIEAARRKAMAEKGQTDQRGASGTGENEWYTPDMVLDAARDVLGEIDLDPASSEAAQAKVQAKAFYTKENDGLVQEWHGRVWLNPPYAQPHIADFVSKMVVERRAGHVTAGIMLTHNYTDTTWFHEAAGCCDAICFTRGRVRFVDAEGVIAAPTQGQAFFYFGSDVTAFAGRFADIGFIVTPYTGEVA